MPPSPDASTHSGLLIYEPYTWVFRYGNNVGKTSMRSTSTFAPTPMFCTQTLRLSLEDTEPGKTFCANSVPLKVETTDVMLENGTVNDPYVFPNRLLLRSVRSITSVPRRTPEGQEQATRTEYATLLLMIATLYGSW